MPVGQLTNVDAVNFRLAQMSQAQAQIAEWTAELFTWQAGLTGGQIEALPAGPSGAVFASGDGANIKGYATECNNLDQVRRGLMYVPQSGSPTVGAGFNFTAFFNIVIGIGV